MAARAIDVLDALRAADLVHICCHSSSNGLHLAEGDLLTAADLQTISGALRARLVVLSACYAGGIDASASIAAELLRLSVNTLAPLQKLPKEEFISTPLDAGLNAPRVFAGNAWSFFFAEVISGILGRSTHIRDDSVCLHINEYDPSNRAHFYINSVLNAGNIDYPFDRSYIGGFDKHIEHHPFPFISSRQLDEARDLLRTLCKTYSLTYTEASLAKILIEVLQVDLEVVLGT